MVRGLLLVVLVLIPVSCAELPPTPEGGTGGDGAGGTAGSDATGGSGGDAGSGGAGGSCTEIIPRTTADTEAESDGVQEGVAIGRVSGNCMMPECAGNEPDDDPVDAWAITTCGNEIKIELNWSDVNNDLDLYVLNASLQVIGSSTQRDMKKPETVVIGGLAEETELLIEVQAWDTSIEETYELTVTPQ